MYNINIHLSATAYILNLRNICIYIFRSQNKLFLYTYIAARPARSPIWFDGHWNLSHQYNASRINKGPILKEIIIKRPAESYYSQITLWDTHMTVKYSSFSFYSRSNEIVQISGQDHLKWTVWLHSCFCLFSISTKRRLRMVLFSVIMISC